MQVTKNIHRDDIDGLRAVAVCAVIIYHFLPNYLPSGFLGVDIFFVISGYVITLHLSKQTGLSWSEYLLNFYSRRIKRLLPALLLCIFTTLGLVNLFLTRPAIEIFNTASYATLGLSNIYLLFQSTDYFGLNSQLNPFTQTWSLGVEEQFYLIFPILLALTGFSKTHKENGTKNAIYLFSLLSLLSLISFIYYMFYNELLAFYSVFTRFWELSVGALIAIISRGRYYSSAKILSPDYFCLILFFIIIITFLLPQEVQILSTLLAVCTSGVSTVLWTVSILINYTF